MYSWVTHARAATFCLLHATKDMPESRAFRRNLSQMVILEWLLVVPTLSACLEPRGNGFMASLGPVCIFRTSQGR
jgi:hypothetical protein